MVCVCTMLNCWTKYDWKHPWISLQLNHSIPWLHIFYLFPASFLFYKIIWLLRLTPGSHDNPMKAFYTFAWQYLAERKEKTNQQNKIARTKSKRTLANFWGFEPINQMLNTTAAFTSPSQPKIFPLTHITSNLSTHAWSIKRR
jgi:hypothetical protein